MDYFRDYFVVAEHTVINGNKKRLSLTLPTMSKDINIFQIFEFHSFVMFVMEFEKNRRSKSQCTSYI